MSGWLSRAKGAFGGREAEISPEPIEIACPCGRKVEATRRRDFQRVLCKNCGEPFFLLPLDVYPRPVMKVRKVKPPKPDLKTKSAAGSKSTSAKSDPQAATAPARPGIDLRKDLSVVGSRVLRQFTPLRLMVLSLLAVIGLTGWWQWTRAARSGAEFEFKTANDAGQVAIQKKDFVEAAQQFSRAANAVDLLRRHDVPAEQARQRFRQLTAINSQLNRSLIELLKAAKTRREQDAIAAVESEFTSLYAGHWIVLQSEVTPPSAPSNSGADRVWEQRVVFDGETLVLTGAMSIFAKVSATPPPPAAPDENAAPDAPPQTTITLNDLGQREVLFAAQVESLKWNAEQSAWVLTLRSSSGFLWTDYDLLLATGFQPDELRTEAQLRALLLEQGRWIGAIE